MLLQSFFKRSFISIRAIKSVSFILLLTVGLVGCGGDFVACEDTGEPVAIDGVGSIETASWMEQLYSESDASLKDIVIPGTHDSGTYAITSSSDLSSVSGQWFYKFAKSVVSGWSKTQACDIATQLNGGIRYLDLRLEWHEDDIWIVHGLLSDTLSNVLHDVKEFSEAHPKEIVILDFQSLTTPDRYAETDAMLQLMLGDVMITNSYNAESSIHELWDSTEGNVIAIMNSWSMADYSDQYWYRDYELESDWANSGDADIVYDHVTNAIDNRATDMFSVAQCVVTANEKYIVAGILGGPNTIEKFNRPINDEINDWVNGWVEEGLPVNIVMTDFYDRSGIVSTILDINVSRLEQP